MDTAILPMLIDGAWTGAVADRSFEVVNPATGKVIAYVADGGKAEIDAAVQAARRSFDSGAWVGLSADERTRILWRVGELIEANLEELSRLEVAHLGLPLTMARRSIGNCAQAFRYYSGWPTKIHGRTADVSKPGMPGFAYTRREPVGVAGLITPWNAPLLMACWKLAPALAAGCSVVLKPAEETPLTSLRLGELMIEAGVPAGVVNIVSGQVEAGVALTEHPDVNKISFTGSTEVGKLIIKASAGNLKRLTLELGGKSPFVIAKDADLTRAIPAAAQTVFTNTGQICAAGSRLFVAREVYDQVVDGMIAAARAVRIGDPLDETTTMGPLVSGRQRDRVGDLIASGAAEGASISTGGGRPEGDGFFIEPTVLTGATGSMRIMREEIFGPVVGVMPFDDPEEIVPQLNDSEYGLASYLFTQNLTLAHRMAARIQAGTVWVNMGSIPDYRAPAGGFKSSGWGREHGPDGVDAYLETKTVHIAL